MGKKLEKEPMPSQLQPVNWIRAFLGTYNEAEKRPVTVSDLVSATDRHEKRHYRSRAKRCCKNGTEFVVVKGNDFRGYKRRGFRWGSRELRLALEKGKT